MSLAWADPSSWFGDSSRNADASQSPDISHLHGPLAPPQPAPRAAVQTAALPAPGYAPPAANIPGARVKVAILLPLTGKDAALGQAMLNAAQQAVFDIADSRFELMPRDTGTGESGAAAAARDAIASGAQLLIGPLFAVTIPAVHTIAQAASLNMLTLSTDVSRAAPDVFVMGFAPDAQVERVVRFAAAHGSRHFAALIPGNAYGSLVNEAFQDAVLHDGGTVVAVETYDPARHDSAAHIRSLAARRGQIDTLFLPEGGADLNLIAGQLTGAGFDNRAVRLLGTGLWDVPDLARQAGFLAGGWYAASDPAARRNFTAGYAKTYGREPPRLATLAYDATALAAVLAKRNMPYDADSLTNPNGFSGLDGIFRLTPDGFVERGLAVIEAAPAGPRTIDPAPKVFAGGG